MSLNWYVIRTITGVRAEFDVLYALHQQERQAMVPFEEKIEQHARTKKPVARKIPFFANYVMAAFEDYADFKRTKDRINELAEMKGKRPPILGLIGPGERPWSLRPDDVEFLRTLSIERPTEIRLHKSFKVGDDIRFLDGVYQGHTAKLVAIDRKRISAMLMMFGQMRPVQVPVTTSVVAA